MSDPQGRSSFDELLDTFYNGAGKRSTFEGIMEALGAESEGLEHCLFLSCKAMVLAQTGDRAGGFILASQALTLAQTLKDPGSVARAHLAMAHILWLTSQHSEAVSHNLRSLAIIEEHGLRGKGSVLGSMGLVYSALMDNETALEYYDRALEEFRDTGCVLDELTVQSNIAICYARIGQVAKSLELLQSCLSMAENMEDGEASAAGLLGNIGFSYMALKQFGHAEDHLRRSIERLKLLNMKREVGVMTTGLAKVYLMTSREDEAIAVLDAEADTIAEYTQSHVHALQIRASHMAAKGDPKGAIELLQEAVRYAEEFGERGSLIPTYTMIQELAKASGDFDLYVSANERMQTLTKEIDSASVDRKLAVREKEQEFEAERQERERERAVLYSTLPQHVADRVIRGDDVSGDHYEAASVLFMDIAGFTTHSSDLEPQETTSLLAEIFHRFDEICAEHGVTKIKTIGDSYMAVSFESAPALARTAMDMMASTHSWPDGSPVLFRIGLHSGPVIAGVIGSQRLQYDIWGDTVNVASRMESTGEAGRIQVSTEFYEQLSSRVSSPVSGIRSPKFTERGEVNIKGKGSMMTYWLEGA